MDKLWTSLLLSAGFLLVGWASDCAWAEPEAQGGIEQPFYYHDHGKRDPFWRLVNAQGVIVNYDREKEPAPKAKKFQLSLEGIVFTGGGESAAMVNGEIVKIGDKVGEYVVQDITPHAVVFKKGEDIVRLELTIVSPAP